MNNLSIPILLVATLFLANCSKNNNVFLNNRDSDFNKNWQFIEDSCIDASTIDFNDAEWQKIDLPHDWSVTDYSVQDSLHVGPFKKQAVVENDQGFLRGGTGWYRKYFTLNTADSNRVIYLNFDGIMSESKVWVNGKLAGHHVYGYTPFNINITPYLSSTEEENLIAIKVLRPQDCSRWFTGAGIYRNVSISKVNPVHVAPWGVSAIGSDITDDSARVDLDITINNSTNNKSEIEVYTALLDPNGEEIGQTVLPISIEPNSDITLNTYFEINNPALWDLETPQLYTANITLTKNGKTIDQFKQPFGIRSLHFSAEKGFLLNGKPILLKGGCVHHDNGLLGAKAFKQAEYRKVSIMKKNGFNAIRSSHNPPSKYLLQACDELGMLVINESFDMWHKAKRENDYHRYYKDWWKKDTRSMVMRDRNHPSIIMWSIGNEIPERALSSGQKIADEAYQFIKSIDNTRPITQAVNGFWDNPGLPWDSSAHAFEQVDIGGYNYQHQQMERDHKMYPDRIMYMSESAAEHIHETWALVKKHPYIIGDFYWTSIDYLGEAGIAKAIYSKNKDAELPFTMPWPWYVSNCGDIDIIGNKKPISYLRDVIWGNSKLEIAVHEPIPDNMHEIIYFWGWTNEYQSWNWKGHENEKLQVHVYSTYPMVQLELNGKVIGEKQPSTDSLTAKFYVPYHPGNLVAIGIDNNGNEIERKVLSTTGEPFQLVLIPERKTIDANRQEITYINIEITDKEGQVIPFDSSIVELNVEGEAELIAAGSGNPKFNGSLQDNKLRLFNGKGIAIIRSNGKEGEIKITGKNRNIKEHNAYINAVK